jgi:hypothetical protein
MSASNNFLFQTIDFSEFGGLFAFFSRFHEKLMRQLPIAICGGYRFANCTAERLADTFVMQNTPGPVIAHVLRHFGSHVLYDPHPVFSSFGHTVRIAVRETDTIVVDYVFVVQDRNEKVALGALMPPNAYQLFDSKTYPTVYMASVRVQRTDAQNFQVEKYYVEAKGHAWHAIDVSIYSKYSSESRKLIESLRNALAIAGHSLSPLPHYNACDFFACALFIGVCVATTLLLFAY